MTNPVTYIFNERGKKIPCLEVKSKNPIVFLEDLVRDTTKPFIIAKLDALTINGKVYDSVAGVTDHPIEVESFYHIPIHHSRSGEEQDILAAAAHEFSKTGARRILVKYDQFETLSLIDVAFDSGNPTRAYLSSTSLLTTSSQRLSTKGKTGEEILAVLLNAPKEYQTSLNIQEMSSQLK